MRPPQTDRAPSVLQHIQKSCQYSNGKVFFQGFRHPNDCSGAEPTRLRRSRESRIRYAKHTPRRHVPSEISALGLKAPLSYAVKPTFPALSVISGTRLVLSCPV